MAFKLDDIVIDRIQMATAESTDGSKLYYVLTQLSEATIETTAESKEAKSAEGSLIKKFYQGKAGTFSATNALINLNVISAASGSEKIVGSAEKKVVMPKICIVKKGEKTLDLTNAIIEGGKVKQITVNALGNNGAMGRAYALSTGEASDTEYKIVVTGDSAVLTLPTDSDADKFVVKYTREEANAVKIQNLSDKFPSTVKLTLKALAVDPCQPDVVKACYIILPSFQVSPELSITLSTEGTIDYKGDLQIPYCAADKELYSIIMCEDDAE